MDAALTIEIAVWLFVVLLISGMVYLAHRFTAPLVKRLAADHKQTYYAWLAHRGRDVELPATWMSGGLVGHDWNTDRDFQAVTRVAGLLILAGFGFGVWLRSDAIAIDQVLVEAALGFVILGGIFFGIRAFMRRKVARALAAAGPLAPRLGSKVVASADGLIVPLGERVVEGVWNDWSLAGVEIEFDKYGVGHCVSITVAHCSRPEEKIPLIASTFENGDDLMAVLAARLPHPA